MRVLVSCGAREEVKGLVTSSVNVLTRTVANFFGTKIATWQYQAFSAGADLPNNVRRIFANTALKGEAEVV